MGHVKWILPSAKARRCTGASGAVFPLWFVILTHHFVDPEVQPIRFDIHQYRDLSVGPWDEEGILETVTSIHRLIEHEIKANRIPAERIVVAGLSQGSAMAVWSGLTFTSGKLAGICGIAGRLPAKELLQEVLGAPPPLTVSDSNCSRCCPTTQQDCLSGWAMVLKIGPSPLKLGVLKLQNS